MQSATPKQKSGAGLLIGGSFVAVIAALALATAGVAIWGYADKQDGGYYASAAHHYQTSARAITTGSVTIGSEVPDWLIGKVRLEASSTKPVFVGIARKADVDSYLAGVAHATVSDLDLDPFKATYVRRQGTATPGRPADQTFWAASGTSALTWKVKSGEWSIVVMNADGSPGVSADIGAGAQIPWLIWAAIGLGVFGAGLLATAALMLFRGTRRHGPTDTAAITPAPAL